MRSRSRRRQKNAMLLALCFATVFLYGCGGSAGVKETTIRIEMLDVTTKAPIENAQLIVAADEPQATGGLAVQITRQLATDSRGKVVFNDLPPDRRYSITAYKDGFIAPGAGGDNDSPAFIPAVPTAGFTVEMGKTYTFTGYLRRANSPTTGTIRGYVYERLSGRPVTNATVWVAVNNSPAIIDTTDKPSKPGYFELNDIPSGPRQLQIDAPGYASLVQQVVVPSGGTVNFDANLGTENGTLRFTVQAQGNDFFVQGYTLIAQVLRNGTEMVAQATLRPQQGAVKSATFVFSGGEQGGGAGETGNGPGIPVLPAGGTDTYTVKVISDDCRMVNPANGISGIVLRQTGASGSGGNATNPVVDAGTIVMAVNKGTVSLTLYQVPFVNNVLTGQTDTNLRTQAPQTSVQVENAFVTTRFVGESPTYFFNYTIEDVPVGNRTMIVNFPSHELTAGGKKIEGVWVLKDQTTRILESIRWSN